jgi:hypothetical protein
MAFLPLVLSAVGTGVAVAGQVQAGRQAAATANYNAQLAEKQAAATDTAARETMRRARIENRRALGQQRAGFAAAGLNPDDGSPLQVQAETAAILQLNAVEEQKIAQQQTQSLLGQASAERLYGQSARRGANLAAAGSLLGGGATVARDLYKLN